MRPSGIGGQAVLEGIMMKNEDMYSVAVRKPDNEIEVCVKEYKGIIKDKKILSLPFIRGVFNFIDSMVLGIKTLTYSASFYEDEEETKPKENSETLKTSEVQEKLEASKTSEAEEELEAQGVVEESKWEKFAMGCTVAFSVVISVGLFMILPYFVSELLQKYAHIHSKFLITALEGAIRITLFILYIFLISRMKDIQRTFMYHGAEHKCINCIEHGYELNVENVRKSSRFHKRCGTSFLFIVMIISVIFFMFIRVDSRLLKVVIRLLLVPVIAGVSYEFIRLAGRSESKWVSWLSAPGLCMQRMTTKEPDDSMIEVAIRAVEAVFDWKQYLQAESKDE